MAMRKCTLLINYASNVGGTAPTTRTGGASESIYILPGTTDYVDKFELVCQARANMLPAGSAVVGQRYQLVDPPGGSSARAARFTSGSAWAADSPQVTLHTRIGSTNMPNVRSYDFKFLPDILQTKGEYTPDPAFNTAVLMFAATLAPFCFKGKDKTTSALKVSSVSQVAAPTWTVVLTGNVVVALGDEFRITRTMSGSGQSFSETVIAKGQTHGSNTIDLFEWDNGTTTGGTIKRITPVYPAFDPASMNVVGTISKKVGGPFAKYRGRASNRA